LTLCPGKKTRKVFPGQPWWGGEQYPKKARGKKKSLSGGVGSSEGNALLFGGKKNVWEIPLNKGGEETIFKEKKKPTLNGGKT